MIAKEITQPKPHLFLDMDGVQANFFTRWANTFGHERYKDIGSKEQREKSIDELNRKGPEWIEQFFATLEPLPGGMRLVAWLKQHNIPFTVLSAPLRNNHEASIRGKRTWLAQHNPGVPAIFTGAKETEVRRALQRGEPPPILVDDFKKYVENWQAAGGHAILYREPLVNDIISQLSKIYNIK